jgi:formylglycine-generating enzyme required for sulfatase activity/uncharacterized caspase-like protein
MRRTSLAFFAALILSLIVAPAFAERRVALVIGNGAYREVPTLPNPRHDAEDVAEALKRTGFETIVGLDLDKARMDEATISFARAARTADIAVIYYSGHAMQFGGVNYLAPIDARLIDEADLRRLTRVDDIVADLQQAKNLRILVLDSCRDNPLAERLKRAIGATRALTIQRGLAKIDSPEGMIISYATQAGRTAGDGDGRNSPYTSAFLRHIEEQDEIGTIFRRIAADVYETTRRSQLPELSLSFIGEFYLHGRVQTPAAPAGAPTADPCAAAGDHWKSAEAIGSTAAFQDHLARFPGCAFAGLAKARIDGLRNKMAVVLPPPATPPPAASGPCGGALAVSLSSRSARPLSTAEECGLKQKDTFKECDNCPEMVVVPAGSFTMGSPVGERDRGNDEGPQHQVTFGQPFAVGRFHVTVNQFAAFVAETGYDADSSCYVYEFGRSFLPWGQLVETKGRSWRNPGVAQDGSHPAACLSWNDARAYVDWLAKKTGKLYRLLTESEWEYAARGRTEPGSYPRNFYGNNERDICRYGNVLDQTAHNIIPGTRNWFVEPCNDGYAFASPVGSFPPNEFGLYDMLGNLWQWTEDCYSSTYAEARPNGSALTFRDCARHVLRGGSWDNKNLRAANRHKMPSGDRNMMDGFRVARTFSP